eukprot:CAMPEP_0203655714 /NCGR_PEP_ID=MMETSP0088-20131115/39189_1 /ASSEMBLY_ACC=CAM_ASM_001087 /TAXON_ID=426623 /ORGANISM="Chaetoceros affinis, Strain CCMP159" /LENGTH=47 /DNA_ID= /DNA_START= /DNA_END= /DNA_ORIENTATION=
MTTYYVIIWTRATLQNKGDEFNRPSISNNPVTKFDNPVKWDILITSQ